MKLQILREFRRATFYADLTAKKAPLHATSTDVKKVLNGLQTHHIAEDTLLGNDDSTEDAPRFPPGGFKAETNSYGPFTHFLNAIIRAARECLDERHLKGLQFYPHGVEMQSTVDSPKPLKPDILGLVHPPPHLPLKVSWIDVAIVVEVKSRQLELVQQLTTYARNYLAVDRRRSFSIAIAFDHKKLKMQFLVFHRSGISSSPELSLSSKPEFQSIVKHMVGILLIPDEETFGLDMTRSGSIYHINNRCYKIVRPIHERKSVRGRATAVYSLRGMEWSS